MEEAWDLYEAAKNESKDGIVAPEALTQAYQDNLSKDIEKRFSRTNFNDKEERL